MTDDPTGDVTDDPTGDPTGDPLGLAPDLLDLLACPCDAHAPLRIDAQAGRLACPACGRSYEVVDQIPVLLLDQAVDGTC